MGHGWVTAPVGSQKTKASEFTYGLEKEKEKKPVFFYQNCSDLLREISSYRAYLLKFEAEGREFAKFLRTIYSNSERSEQFLVTECFFNLFLEINIKQ